MRGDLNENQTIGNRGGGGMPAMFCDCEKCRKATMLGGRNIRSRSQAIVNDRLLIDFPCDTFYHLNLNHIDITKINHCIITHAHSDHYYEEDFNNIWAGSHPPEGLSLSCIR